MEEWWCPREDSNPQLGLRRALLYPVKRRGQCILLFIARGFYAKIDEKLLESRENASQTTYDH
jgi:hypothetical protein